ncbi:MAG TPA: carbohydrate binding domain-containing protein [Elusimicrobiota bacterium]|nr:carbohydrate binding domain-containing protein [Elusimicrobiota bacterium]
MIAMIKHRNHFLIAGILLLSCAGFASSADRQKIADFDQLSPDTFAFKDEKGSLLNANSGYSDDVNGHHLGVKYEIVAGGWGGWGVPLKGMNVSQYRYLSFSLKGNKGGENFEVGLRDTAGQEKKFPVAKFADVSSQWQQILIPLSDFAGLNLSSLDNINFGFTGDKGFGMVYIDNLSFEGASSSSGNMAPGSSQTLVNKILVDGFERTSPADVYRIFQGDESTLKLASSRMVYDGDYAMELEYQFSTTRPWGSWVSAHRVVAEKLDWTGAQEVKMWVKGDGSGNTVRLRILESSGEVWELDDADVLMSTKWRLMSMPLVNFQLLDSTKVNGELNLDDIQSYEILILSPTSQQSAGAKTSSGKIWVDQLYVVGERLPAVRAAPPDAVPTLRQAVAAIGNVDFSMVAYTEYFFTPEEKSRINHYAKLIANAKLKQYSARVEFGSASQEFGDASAYQGSSVAANTNQFANVEMPSMQIMANNLSPYLTNLTVGNLFVDYSLYTFAPVFGYKGASVEGDVDRINYHAFVLKHVYNSFTAGTRVKGLWPHTKVTGIAVYWEQNARLNNMGTVSGGTLTGQSTNIFELRRVAQDAVYTLEAERKLFGDVLSLWGAYGVNEYRQSAEADYTNAFQPAFTVTKNPSLDLTGRMWRGRIQTVGFPWNGLTLSYLYRDVGTQFKPHYRQSPVNFDETESDQYGHNFLITQHHKGWVASSEYDTLHRNSNRAFYRHRMLWGLGYYGYKGMDMAFNQEHKRDLYTFTSNRSSLVTTKDEKMIANEIYIRTQLSPRMAFWIRPRQERRWIPSSNTNQVANSFQSHLDYYISTNARFVVEQKISNFDNPAYEPQGYPFDDNYVRVSFELSF